MDSSNRRVVLNKYKIEKIEKDCFQLIEIPSSNIIASFQKWKDAYNAFKFFSTGGGFAGWTPAFITKN